MGTVETAPTRDYCSRCRTVRRLRFAGYASDGRENGVRPRALYRQCETCGATTLVLGDARDALGLVRNAIADWRRATGYEIHSSAGSSAYRTIDLDDLEGELTIALWTLYSGWDPAGLTFTSYASGLLPRRIASYIRDAVGSESLYRRNGRKLVRVWPKAHATSVCDSLDGAARPSEDDDGDRGRDRLALALGLVQTDAPANRSPDLARVLGQRDR
jgi:hypothetical protein